MTDEDVHEHELVEKHDLDGEIVCRIIEKCNNPRKGITDIAKEVKDVLDVDLIDAEELVEAWREPDWPIEYSKTFEVESVDVFEDFMLNYRGYEPHFTMQMDWVTVTWRIDKRKHSRVTSEYDVDIIEVNGVDYR